MELPTLVATTILMRNVYQKTQFHATFLNVCANQNLLIHCLILTVKCLAAGYGMRRIVPGTATYVMLVANFTKSCVIDFGVYLIAFHIFHFSTTAFAQAFCHDIRFSPILNGIIWLIACLHAPFQFFVDVYLVVMLVWYTFGIFEREIEKFCSIVFYVYCLDWLTETVHGGKNIGMVHAAFALHIPIILFTSFGPINKAHTFRFLSLTTCLAAWLAFKLSVAGFKYGVTRDGYFILNETREYMSSMWMKFADV